MYQKTQWFAEPESKNVFLPPEVVELVDVEAPTTLTVWACTDDVTSKRESSVQEISAHARTPIAHRLVTGRQY